MDDQGFDFRTSPDRREPKRFEPPPWEADAFEALKRDREEAQEQEPEGVGDDTHAVPEYPAVQAQPVPAKQEVPATVPSDAEVVELLAGLAQQEPDPRGPATAVTIGSAMVLLPIGVMLLVWGMVAFAKAGAAVTGVGIARTGAATMIVFGVGFVASAFWLIYRLMRQRGVL